MCQYSRGNKFQDVNPAIAGIIFSAVLFEIREP